MTKTLLEHLGQVSEAGRSEFSGRRASDTILAQILEQFDLPFSVKSISGNLYYGTLLHANRGVLVYRDVAGVQRQLRLERLNLKSFKFSVEE